MARAESNMTLVFDIVALQRLADPAAAVEDAGQWSAGVGVAAEDHDELRAYLDRKAVDPDFIAGKRGFIGGLAAVRQRITTDRHVFIGTTDEAKATAEAVGWEYLDVEEAARKADWPLAEDNAGN